MNARSVSSWSSLLVLLLVAGKQRLANAMETSNDFVTSECVTGLFRLPTRVQPVNYRLHLWPEMEKEFFHGHVEIELEIGKMNTIPEMNLRSLSYNHIRFITDPTKIILNAENLLITGLKFQQDGGPSSTGICYDADSKILVVELDGAPAEGSRAVLAFNFRGVIQNKPEGLFRSSIAPDKWVLATNLHPFYARRLFPCFDEPEFKATFDLTIDHPIRTTVLSNTRLQNQDPLVFGSRRSIFERTPRMSSHLLSFTVGEFTQFQPSALHEGMSITIYAPVGWAVDASEMLEKAVEAYAAAAQFFAGIPQPMRKIDIVAAKSGHHGMKNWGLITMSRNLLSAGARRVTPDDWHRAVTGLMKEIVRFWLGNLVTMRWWDDLWLMEGLAGYLANELAAKKFPEISDDFYTLLDTTASAMKLEDEMAEPHPIKDVRLKTSADILASYDSLTYKKSEAVLRMFVDLLGKENFNSAIRNFVDQRRFNLLDSTEWWHMLANNFPEHSEVLGRAYKWIQQPGYPIITVTKKKNTLHFKQESSLRDGRTWVVPINYVIHVFVKQGKSTSGRHVLANEIDLHPLDYEFTLKNNYNRLRLNANYEGYYRVVYSVKLKNALLRTLEKGQMEPVGQSQLLSDLYSQERGTKPMIYFERMLRSLSDKTHDGVILLLTRLLTQLYDSRSTLSLSKEVSNLLMSYHINNGGVWGKPNSNVLKQYTRSRVAHYLEHKLKNPQFLKEIQEFRKQALASSSMSASRQRAGSSRKQD